MLPHLCLSYRKFWIYLNSSRLLGNLTRWEFKRCYVTKYLDLNKLENPILPFFTLIFSPSNLFIDSKWSESLSIKLRLNSLNTGQNVNTLVNIIAIPCLQSFKDGISIHFLIYHLIEQRVFIFSPLETQIIELGKDLISHLSHVLVKIYCWVGNCIWGVFPVTNSPSVM